jgi:hypothetical protein
MEKIEYIVPINNNEEVKKYNEKFPGSYKTTVEHLDELMDKLYNGIRKVGDENGWYKGDVFKVSITIEYLPEDK